MKTYKVYDVEVVLPFRPHRLSSITKTLLAAGSTVDAVASYWHNLRDSGTLVPRLKTEDGVRVPYAKSVRAAFAAAAK